MRYESAALGRATGGWAASWPSSRPREQNTTRHAGEGKATCRFHVCACSTDVRQPTANNLFVLSRVTTDMTTPKQHLVLESSREPCSAPGGKDQASLSESKEERQKKPHVIPVRRECCCVMVTAPRQAKKTWRLWGNELTRTCTSRKLSGPRLGRP